MPGSTHVSYPADTQPVTAAITTPLQDPAPAGGPGQLAPWFAPALAWAGGAVAWPISPVIGLLLVAFGVVLVWRRRVPTHVAAIAVPVTLTMLWGGLGLLAGFSHVPVFTTEPRWWIGWLVVTGTAAWLGTTPLAWVAARRPTAAGSPGVRRVRGAARWAFAPAVVFALLAAFQSTSAEIAGRWLTRATDPMQLILLMQQMAREGSLVYGRNLGSSGDLAAQAYPKGLHWLATASLGPAAPPSVASPEALALYLRTFAGFVWLTVALLLCVGAGLFLAAARRWDLGVGTVLAATGWLTVLLVCVEQFGGVVLVQGAFASAVAVACVWALVWLAVTRPRIRVTAAALSAALFLTANTWQPMVPVLAVVGAVLLWPYRRGLVTWLRTPRGRRLPVVAAVILLGALVVVATAAPVVAVVLAGGTSVAGAAGGIQKPFLPGVAVELVAVAAALLGSLRSRFHDRTIAATVTAVVIATTVVWLLAAIAAGWQPFAYYPDKVLWFLALSGWPLAAFLLGLVTSAATSWLSHRPTPVRWVTSRGPTAVLCSGLILLSVLSWLVWRSPSQLVTAATGRMGPSVPLSLGTLPRLPEGFYMPYLLGSTREANRTPEYEAAKILAFRFGTPYLPWGSRTPSCRILQSRSPVVLVTVHPHSVVSRSLREAHCTLRDWQILQLPSQPSPSVDVLAAGDPGYRG